MKTLILILIFGIMALPTFGATRFYLPSTGTAVISPAYAAGWVDTSAADNIRCVTQRTNTTMNDEQTGNINTQILVLNRQYVSDPIAAQNITGTVKGQLLGMESAANQDMVSAIGVRVVSNDGSTVRGTLLSITYPVLAGNEYGTSHANRYTPVSTAVSSVTAQNGDRIVIEIGCYRYAAGNPPGRCTQRFGDDGATDLPEDQTTTTDTYNPWVEFSADFRFLPSVTLID
jgi:hypothetical protein